MLDEVLHHGQCHVRLQQRRPHFAQGVLDVALGQAALAANFLERFVKSLG